MATSTSMSRPDCIWLVREVLSLDGHIKAGSRDRYMIGRRNGLATVASRLLRVGSDDFNRYMAWVYEQAASGTRVGDLEEPTGWIRKNPA